MWGSSWRRWDRTRAADAPDTARAAAETSVCRPGREQRLLSSPCHTEGWEPPSQQDSFSTTSQGSLWLQGPGHMHIFGGPAWSHRGEQKSTGPSEPCPTSGSPPWVTSSLRGPARGPCIVLRSGGQIRNQTWGAGSGSDCLNPNNTSPT